MRDNWLIVVSVLVVAAGLPLLGGCDDSSEDKTVGAGPLTVNSAREPVVVEETTGSGIVRGVVRLNGTPPVMQTIENKPCHDGATPIQEETVLVNDDGTLRNVFVYVQGAPRVSGAGKEPAVLDQVNCRYVPHVLGIQVDQRLRIRSSDPTLHNVHYNPSRNEAQNFGFTSAGAERVVTFKAPEIIRTKCDVHPWMSAYIGVFENPLFAIAADGGTYEIKGLPAGTYTLTAWHEKYGEQSQEIVVEDEGVPVEVNITFGQ